MLIGHKKSFGQVCNINVRERKQTLDNPYRVRMLASLAKGTGKQRVGKITSPHYIDFDLEFLLWDMFYMYFYMLYTRKSNL